MPLDTGPIPPFTGDPYDSRGWQPGGPKPPDDYYGIFPTVQEFGGDAAAHQAYVEGLEYHRQQSVLGAGQSAVAGAGVRRQTRAEYLLSGGLSVRRAGDRSEDTWVRTGKSETLQAIDDAARESKRAERARRRAEQAYLKSIESNPPEGFLNQHIAAEDWKGTPLEERAAIIGYNVALEVLCRQGLMSIQEAWGRKRSPWRRILHASEE